MTGHFQFSVLKLWWFLLCYYGSHHKPSGIHLIEIEKHGCSRIVHFQPRHQIKQQLHCSTLVKFHVSCTILEEECSNTKCRTVIQKSAEQCSILTIEICHNLWFEVCLWKTSISIHCLAYQRLSHLCTDSNIGGRSCYVIWWPAQQEQYPIQNDSWYFYGKPFTHTHTQMGQPSGDLAQGHSKPSAIWLVDDLF